MSTKVLADRVYLLADEFSIGTKLGNNGADFRVILWTDKNAKEDATPITFVVEGGGFSMSQRFNAADARSLATALLAAADQLDGSKS